MQVRRIVTDHDVFGKGIVVTDEAISAMSRGMSLRIEGCEIWSSAAMPVDNSMAAAAGQRAGFVKTFNYVDIGQGTTVRITEWAPGHAIDSHRTETLDYSIRLSGEIDVELDGGETVHMKAGHVIVMRGVTHCWKNHGPGPAVTAFILIGSQAAKPPDRSTMHCFSGVNDGALGRRSP